MTMHMPHGCGERWNKWAMTLHHRKRKTPFEGKNRRPLIQLLHVHEHEHEHEPERGDRDDS
jgi:hypothetical protein